MGRRKRADLLVRDLVVSQVDGVGRATRKRNRLRRDYLELGVFEPLRHALLTGGDHYMHLADLKSYLQADEALLKLYADQEDWAEKVILNIAGSGKFSSDRTIAEYAASIWNVEPCPTP